MHIANSGYIFTNKPLTEEALQALKNQEDFDNELLECLYGNYPGNADTFEIEEWYENCFEDQLEAMVAALAPLGYVLNGEIQYWGDYDGKIYVQNNKVITVDIADTGLYEASDAELIQILEQRGYRVEKATEEEKSTAISATFISIWDDGFVVETPCKVNPETKEVYDIEETDVSGLEILHEEEICINGKTYPVCPAENLEVDDAETYWYA